ncbi:DNA cytosine methyltransferase, partial [Listeria monocytogenes]|uniref:DNA cytosine methyltransferase n=1 Tax=Listeria monocytogenes TaxID=1639 RepID=UPI002FDC5CB2
VVAENVRGLTNWNRGLVFNEVQVDLETSGFEVLPFLLPACAVNAPHRRDRIWFIAYSINGGYTHRLQVRKEKRFATHGNPFETDAQ